MSDKYNMSGHKLLWHLDRLGEYADGRSIAPLNVQLGITDGCNFDCVYCYGAAGMGRVGMAERIDMPIEAIKRFLKDAKDVGVRSVSLVGEGENTIHPDFYEVLECARDVGIDLGMASNGIALKNDRIKEVLESLVWLRFSVGGATRDVYQAVHGRDMFDVFVDKVARCVEVKRANGLDTTIGLQMVVLNNNVCDIVKLAELGSDLGVDYFVAKPCSDTPDGKLGVQSDDFSKFEPMFLEAESYATEDYNVVIKRSKFANMNRNDFDCCRATNFVIQISAKGVVAPCGHLLGYRADEFNMGNIVTHSFKDIVSSARYRDVQNKVTSLDVNEECETNCLHYYMNQFLMGLENIPDHINFV